MSRSQEMGVSRRVWSILSGKQLSKKVRTKSIIELRHPSHYILSDSTEPRVGVDWELSEVSKGRQQG